MHTMHACIYACMYACIHACMHIMHASDVGQKIKKTNLQIKKNAQKKTKNLRIQVKICACKPFSPHILCGHRMAAEHSDAEQPPTSSPAVVQHVFLEAAIWEALNYDDHCTVVIVIPVPP